MSLNDLPQQKLREIILQYGRSVCDDPQRCEALLRDYCGQYRKEISVLVNALKERVPTDLLASQSTIPIPHLLKFPLNIGKRISIKHLSHQIIFLPHLPKSPKKILMQEGKQIPLFSNPTVARENNSRLAKANQQIRNAWIAGTISGTITLIFTFVLTEPFLLIDVLLIFGLTWGIYQKSRACAVIMFIYFIISKIVSWQTFGNPMSLLVAILFIYSFWQGIQGTFAYHKINKI